jgi:ribonuclease BN (tRNA processing enzyme)
MKADNFNTKYIKFLGTGSAFTMKGYQTNMLLLDEVRPEFNLLIDCGTDIRFALAKAGLTHRDIKNVGKQKEHVKTYLK